MSGNANKNKYPNLENEKERLEALHSYHILDTAEEKDFDDLTSLAAAICGTPIALVSLVDQDRQWFKSHTGLSDHETPRNYSFCAHAIAQPEHTLIVPNAKEDSRFSDNPLVTGALDITFYAGVPLINQDGFALGSLCVIDQHARELSAEQINSLIIIAKQVIDKLELRRKVYQLEQLNQLLQISEAKYRNLIDKAPVAIAILKGPELIIESANEQILTIWEQDQSILNKPLMKVFPELEGKSFLEKLDQVFINGRSENGLESKVTNDFNGVVNESFYSYVCEPLKDDLGVTHSIMVVATDITERKVVEQRKDDFLGMVSHELKTPITSLNANLQLLDKYKSNPANPIFPRLIDLLGKSTNRINLLVDDLLEMHRHKEGQLKLNKTTFKAVDLLNACCNHVRIEGKYELVILGDEKTELYADEHRIDQVILNFVNNAVKYASKSKIINLIVTSEADQVKIAVQDFGPGIPSEQIPHLFDRYWRSDHSSTAYSGLGLGLYICSEIIKKHGGHIGAISEPGSGSTFWFSLPAK
jgi:signal transduction histidine kinase